MRSLKDWFEYVERQAKELEKKKKEAEAKPAQQEYKKETKIEPVKGKGVVFDEIYLGGEGETSGGRGVNIVMPSLDAYREEKSTKWYKRGVKETREEFLQRLLDPVLTLQEVARLLNVCPMTVRRYTNKGILPSFRTAGNQRRFRLSDVLRFIEQREGKKGGEQE